MNWPTGHRTSAPPGGASRRRTGPLAALLAAAVGLAACSGGGSHRPPATTVAPAPTSAGPAATPIAWSACPDHPGWDCGTLAVPLDHAHPGPTITLALSRHKATGTSSGPLLVNPGGPGVSGLDFAYSLPTTDVFATLVHDFDIIGFDPRGVGQSSPIECVDGPTLDRISHLDPVPSTPAKLAALVAGAKQLAAACGQRNGALLAHVSTIDAAEDMDDIRAALGRPTLSYLGFSYGTFLGATYAHLFPTHVRALVLDSAIDPAVDESTMTVAQAASFEQNLNAFLASCTTGCAFQRHGAPTLRAAFDALMARIDASPLPAGGGRTLGPGEALYGVADPLYSQDSWPALASGLEDAENGNGATLLSYFDDYAGRHGDGTYDNSLEANTAINCLDHPAPPSLASFTALATRAAAVAPYFGPATAWGALPCLYWPVRPVGQTAPIHAPGAPPILVIGSTGDPATPYVWSQHLATELGTAVLITRHGEGHAAYLVSACVRKSVDAYLLTRSVPSPPARDCSS